MRRPSRNAWLVIIALLVIVIPLGVAVLKMFVTHEVPFLRPEAGARWVKLTEPVSLRSWKGTFVVDYRRQFILAKDFPDSVLTVRALRTAQVYLDGQIISAFNDRDDGKNPRFVEMRGLTQGPHELGIAVKNETGPALLLAYCSTLGIFTGPGWETSLDGINWLPVSLAEERRTADLSLQFPSAMEAFRTLIPIYLPLFVISFLLALFFRAARKKYPWTGNAALSPSQIRWLLLAGWALLAVNNISKIPLYIGFDASGHYAYILYILERRTIPLATDGWQMFQSPLYYLLSAGLLKLLSQFFSATTVSHMLRIIPLLCGALQVQMAYQAVRYVFPGRQDLQTTGTIIGGLLPMNLYISQVLGNEPLAGVLSAAAIVLALGILTREGPLPKKKMVILGVVTGLACLTKVTAVLLIPGLVLVLIYAMSKKNEPPQSIIGGLVMFLGAVVVVSGWYYLRNWIALGRPFVGGWEISRGIVWWQEPGYRTIQDFISFGRSLTHPLFSALNGFWDSIYSTFWLDGLNSSVVSYKINPPWNYDFMLSSALLALLPTAGIIFGLIMSLRRPWAAHPGQVFAVYSIAVYFAALLYLYVTVPIYSTAKATYTIGLVPCYAVICVTGLDYLTRTRYLRAAVYGLLACWAVSVYASYFVV
jgi:4-amino-4-deoxy-L-arabinose transferase-like glycosyltransferase